MSLAACGGVGSTGSAAPSTASASAALVDIGSGLSGPPGLAATVVATGLANVAALAIDGNGRLWASTAAFSDAGTDAVYLVAASGVTRVIANLHTPLGLAWVGDRLYFASAAGVEAFGGFDGASFATRTTILTLPDGVGEVNGLAVAPDGSLVLGISAPCDACDPDQAFAGAVIGFAADGTGAHVIAGGLRAPVGLAVVPGTSTLLASENQRDDLGDATPGDWLIRVEAGQDWGFPACYGQDDATCADAPAPVATLDAHAAASGVAVVGGDTAVVAEWAKGVVLGVDLWVAGGGVTATSAPRTYLAGLSQPVGLLTGGGALYVGDWGSGTMYRVTGV